MENKKPKTIDEFFIEKYEKLEEEIEVLKKEQEGLFEMNYNLGEERDEYKNKYNGLINKLKKDFNIQLKDLGNDDKYIYMETLYSNIHVDKEKYEYYKEMFNLKEEGEEDNE